MSLTKHTSPYQKVELSEDRKRSTSSCSMPIECRACDKVFFDNVSLVLHFECHLEDEISLARLHGRDLAFLPSGRYLSLGLSQFSSSVKQMNKGSRALLPRRNKCSRPLSVFSAITPPNSIPTDVSLVHIPVLNSMPPINSSFGARRNGQVLSKDSKPFRHSTMSHHRVRSSDPRSAPVPALQLRGQNGGQGHPLDYKNPHMKQLKKRIPEIIVISDDEEDENKHSDDEIDLSLKL